MTRKIWILLWVLVGCLATLVACGKKGDGTTNVYIAYKADSGRAVTMHVGDELRIILTENPTTGYVWSIVTNDEKVLGLSGDPTYEGESDAVGAGGERSFIFRATAPGTSTLQLINSRPWETAAIPAETFQLTVQVVE